MASVEEAYCTTEAIIEFISDNKFLKDVTVLQIFNVVTQIQNQLEPLLARHTISSFLAHCLTTTQGVLSSTLRNLRESQTGRSSAVRSFLNKRTKTRELKDDRDILVSQHVALLSAVQVVSHVKGFNIITPVSSIRRQVESKSVQSLKMKAKMLDSDVASLYEADHFWKCYVGTETSLAESDEFGEVLSLWMGEPLNDLARKRLLLRLDEANTGTISFSTFKEFIRQGNLRETVSLYTSDPPLPLLIWIDDDVGCQASNVIEATEQGITVYQLSSTASTRAWIMANKDFLKKHQSSGQIRIVAGQILHEQNDYHLHVMNDKAGNQITSFVRESEDLKIPILIYTSKSNLYLTKYVQDYDMTGSLGGNYLVFQAYVAALASGHKGDTRWMRYNA